jgi:RNA polymerase sigma-70 factor, ECF subfamily
MNQGLNLGLVSKLQDGLEDTELAPLTDEVLIMQLCDGNDDALATLFDRYYRMVLNVAHRILRDAGEAEDLMQSVFLGIFRSAKQFDPARGTVKIWILQCAYNQAFNRRRYLTLRGIYSGWNGADLTQIGEVYGKHYLGELELAQAMKEALRELRRSHREVLEYAFYDGLTMREIAEKTGKTFHTVRHEYYRALEKLRCIWSTYVRPADATNRFDTPRGCKGGTRETLLSNKRILNRRAAFTTGRRPWRQSLGASTNIGVEN